MSTQALKLVSGNASPYSKEVMRTLDVADLTMVVTNVQEALNELIAEQESKTSMLRALRNPVKPIVPRRTSDGELVLSHVRKNEMHDRIYEFIATSKVGVGRNDIVEALQLTPDNVSLACKALRDAGRIRSEGKTIGTLWFPV